MSEEKNEKLRPEQELGQEEEPSQEQAQEQEKQEQKPQQQDDQQQTEQQEPQHEHKEQQEHQDDQQQTEQQEPHQQPAEKQDKPVVERDVDVKEAARTADVEQPVPAADVGEKATETGKNADAGENTAETGKNADAGEKAAENGQAAQAAGADAPAKKTLTPEERAAKRAAAAAAKAAKDGAGDSKAAKPAAAKEEAADEKPKEPSPNQPLLDKLMASIQEGIGNDVIEEGYINEVDGHLPVIVVNSDRWFKTAVYLKEQHQLNYLINLSGVDRETHLEVVYHIESFETNEQICVTVKTDRDAPSIPSVTPVWSTANWPEREVYDLLGVDFPGHPDLRRIMMPDDWVGHPLRKDYEPLDPEV